MFWVVFVGVRVFRFVPLLVVCMSGGGFRDHAGLAVRMFSEGVESMGRGDVAWACAAFYKAVEEAVKALAIAKNLDETREALARDRWTMRLLDSAARRLGDTAWCAWVHGYFLYTEGFGEGRLDAEGVRARVPIIEALIREVRRLLGQ